MSDQLSLFFLSNFRSFFPLYPQRGRIPHSHHLLLLTTSSNSLASAAPPCATLARPALQLRRVRARRCRPPRPVDHDAEPQTGRGGGEQGHQTSKNRQLVPFAVPERDGLGFLVSHVPFFALRGRAAADHEGREVL